MWSDVVLPLLIIAGCAAFMGLVHLVTRPRPSRLDITPPTPSAAPEGPSPEAISGSVPAYSVDLDALEDWHVEHGEAVLTFMEAVDDLVDPEVQSEDVDDDLADRLALAAESHPAPEMRSELAGLVSAATAMAEARARSDAAASDRHRFIYVTYRRLWLERLEQFGVDRKRVRAAVARYHRASDATAQEPSEAQGTSEKVGSMELGEWLRSAPIGARGDPSQAILCIRTRPPGRSVETPQTGEPRP